MCINKLYLMVFILFISCVNTKYDNEGESMNKNIEIITDFLKCDYEVIKGGFKNGYEIMDLYKTNLEKGKIEGYTPLIIIPTEYLSETLEIAKEDNDIENANELVNKFIEVYKNINVKDYINQNLEDVGDIEDIKDYYDDTYDSFISIYDLEGNITTDLILAKIPTSKPYELALYIPMGGFNDCPNPEVQVSVFKYWYDKYKAYPAVVGYDTFEIFVENKPQNKDDAIKLAFEQFAFCSDIVSQGIGDISLLAGMLLKSDIWYFWWD